MHCLFCGNSVTQVKDSRIRNNSVKRRRICTVCGKKFFTIEKVYDKKLCVVKKSGSVKPFEKEKIFFCLYHCSKKLNIKQNKLQQITDDIVRQAYELDKVHTKDITRIIKNTLKTHSVELWQRFCAIYV